jgi:hypothetical protein
MWDATSQGYRCIWDPFQRFSVHVDRRPKPLGFRQFPCVRRPSCRYLSMKLIAAVAMSVLALGACSSSRDQAEPPMPRLPAMPSVVGMSYGHAISALSSAGLCADRVVVFNPNKLRRGRLPTVGVVYAQQPGPVDGGSYPYRVTLEMIGGAPQRQEVSQHTGYHCQAPLVVQGPSALADQGAWYVGTPAEAGAARTPATSN